MMPSAEQKIKAGVTANLKLTNGTMPSFDDKELKAASLALDEQIYDEAKRDLDDIESGKVQCSSLDYFVAIKRFYDAWAQLRRTA